MKVVYKDQAEKFNNGKFCAALEYSMEDKDLNGAIIELTGRYPEKGRVVNLKCKELAYVIKGSGKVAVDDKETNLKEGDLILIQPGEKYFWDGNLTLFVPCAPAWNPEQYKEVE
ncbi:MAG: cupin domain-containing protein [Patescibacteria group bacterium]|jgi:mannose-6-phosphate isomerase-like protein (cupin superfamily)